MQGRLAGSLQCPGHEAPLNRPWARHVKHSQKSESSTPLSLYLTAFNTRSGCLQGIRLHVCPVRSACE